MSKKSRPLKSRSADSRIADPAALLEAAKAAPTVFSIGAYYAPLYVMRDKGYSWRYLADWLKGHNIEVSHVHLHRMYAKESIRLTRLTRKELQELGMPHDMIDEIEEKKDPTKRLTAADPEDVPTDDEEEDRR